MTHPDTPRPPMSETVKPLSQEELDEQRALEPNGSSAVFRGRWLATIADREAKLEKAERDLAQSREWRPIESAPRDGTKVLVTNDVPGALTFVAYWVPPESRGRDYCQDDDWWHITHALAGVKPTHWMPIPPPPTTGSAP